MVTKACHVNDVCNALWVYCALFYSSEVSSFYQLMFDAASQSDVEAQQYCFGFGEFVNIL